MKLKRKNETEKETIQLVPIGQYMDKLLECRQCIHEFECRGPWVYEPWCPKDLKGFTFEPKEHY